MVIMDSNDKGSESEDMQSPSPRPTNELKRCCVDCHTTRTPCWRGGPAGPRTLCNACGIRYRKKRKAILGLVQGTAKKSNNKRAAKSSSSSSSCISEGREMGLPLEAGLMGFVRGNKNNRNVILPEKLKESREVEQAAILLMALSNGSVYA